MTRHFARALVLAGLLAGVVVGCSMDSPTAPGRDPRCFYPGDTIALLTARDNATGRVLWCAYITSRTRECYGSPVVLQHLVCPPAGAS